MAKVVGYQPVQGEQKPQNYPFVGANYKLHGEQPGFVYDPYRDQYYADRRTPEDKRREEIKKKIEDEQLNQLENPKGPPGMLETLGPVAGVGAAYFGGKALGEKLPGWLGSIGESTPATNPTGLLEAPNVVGANALPSGGVAPVLPGAEGAAAGAPSSLTGLLAPAAVAAIGAYTANKGLEGYEAGRGQGALGGLKAGWDAAGPLKYVPLLGQAPALAGMFGGLFDTKSTRTVARENTDELMNAAGDDAGAQAYVQGMREQYNSAPVDPSKPFAGKYGSWDEYQKAGLEAADLTGVYGNIKAATPQRWAALTQAQRQAVTQENINAGNYFSEKGDVLVKDEGAFNEILNRVAGATATPLAAPAAPTGMLAPGIPGPTSKDQLIPRSGRSPGIDKNGNRIAY